MTIRVWDLYARECVRVLSGHVAQVQSLRVITLDDHTAAGFPSSTLAGPSLSQDNGPAPTFHFATSLAPSTSTAATTSIGVPLTDVLGHSRYQVVPGNAYEGFFDTPDTSSCSAPRPALVNAAASTARPPAPANFLAAAARPTPDATTLPRVNFGLETGNKPLVVSASLDNTIKVWDVEGGVCARTMFGHIEGVWDVDVDKLRIISGSHDRTLKIWDKDSGRCLHTLVGHTSAVTAVSLQDQYAITGSDDATVRIWNFARSQAGTA